MCGCGGSRRIYLNCVQTLPAIPNHLTHSTHPALTTNTLLSRTCIFLYLVSENTPKSQPPESPVTEEKKTRVDTRKEKKHRTNSGIYPLPYPPLNATTPASPPRTRDGGQEIPESRKERGYSKKACFLAEERRARYAVYRRGFPSAGYRNIDNKREWKEKT